MSELTKKSSVWDFSKIGVGDIVEFEENEIKILPFTKTNKYMRVGIVTDVSTDTLWIKTQANVNKGHLNFEMEEFGIPVDRSHQVRLIYRSYYNRKE